MKSRRDFMLGTLAVTSAVRPAAGGDPKTAIDATLRSGIQARKIPAVVGAVANGKQTLYAGAFGVHEEAGPPVTIDSIFAIASMTKPVTTVAALQLVEAGKLSLQRYSPDSMKTVRRG